MKYLIVVFLLHLVFPGWGQDYTLIKGSCTNSKWEEVKLFQAVEGKPQFYASTQIARDGSYGFILRPEEPGFYAIGSEKINFIVYIQGGEEINIDLLETQARLNGRNTRENEKLYQWEDYAADIRLKSLFFDKILSDYEDFFPEFNAFLQNLDKVRKEWKSGNSHFDELFQKLIDYETDFFAIMFLQTPRTKHPERSVWPEFYKHVISEQKFHTDEILQFPHGMQMLDNYINFATLESGQNPIGHTDAYLAYLPNDHLKGEYIVSTLFSDFKSYDQYLEGMEKYGKYLTTPLLKRRAEAIGTQLYDTKPGGRAADFTYPDQQGKMVSLSDFPGKVVVVDVWATWCGPCRTEIPHLKKLEEEMREKDVVFLGVSLDEKKNKQKWLDVIKTEGLHGVQLFADGWSKITKDYKITGIPRFLVFDKQGHIATTHAPRPSSPELKKLLLRLLAD